MSTPCHVDLILEEKAERVPISGLGKKKRSTYANTSFKPRKLKAHKATYSAKKRKAAAAVVAAAEGSDSVVKGNGAQPSKKKNNKAAKSAARKDAKKADK